MRLWKVSSTCGYYDTCTVKRRAAFAPTAAPASGQGPGWQRLRMSSHLEATQGCLMCLAPLWATNRAICPADITGTRFADLRMSLRHILGWNPSPKEVHIMIPLWGRMFGKQVMVHGELEEYGLKSHYMVQLAEKTEAYLRLIWRWWGGHPPST